MVTAPTLQDKFHELEDAMNVRILERFDVVHTMNLALIAGLHHYQLGLPGTAKTRGFDVMRKLIVLDPEDLFEILMTRYTTPDEIEGVRDIAAMKEGRVSRITAGMAPVAKLWKMDEIFKGSSSILNFNLMALEERRYKNHGKVLPINLHSMFCMSNELPEGEELNALFDRIHFRHEVHPIKEPGAFVSMLAGQFTPIPAPILAWNEIEQAHKEAAAVEIAPEVFDTMNNVRLELRSKEITPSDRRFAVCLKAIQAQAWLEGETVAGISHMSPLSHMLWSVPEQWGEVFSIIGNLADPIDKEATDLIAEVDKLDSRLTRLLADKDMDPLKQKREGVEIHRASRQAKNDFRGLRERIKDNSRKPKTIEDCRVKLLALTRRLLTVLDMEDLPDDTDLEA